MKQHHIFDILFLSLFALFLACAPAFAATQVATVVAARGEVQALDAKGKSRPLAVQAPIFEEDTIKTGARSRVQIMFADNTLINLGNATSMKIAEYRWQPEQNDGALKTKIEEGTFRIMGGALAKKAPQNFKTETPTATIGIRGSMYAGLVTPNFLSVVFQGGKGIDVTNSFGTVSITKPGFGTKVAMSKPPLPPVKFTAQELGDLNKALGGNGAEDNGNGNGDSTGNENPPASTDEEGATAAPAPADTASVGGEGVTPDPSLGSESLAPVVPNLTQDVIANNSQTILDNTITETAATQAATTTSLSGNYLFFSRDEFFDAQLFQYYYSTYLLWESGTVNATLSLLDSTGVVDTVFASSSANLTDGTTTTPLPSFMVFPAYTYTGFTPAAASYTGFDTVNSTFSYNVIDVGLINMTMADYIDPIGQFLYNVTSFSNQNFIIGSLGYAGIPSSSIPTTGIAKFTGHLIYNSPDTLDADLETTEIRINWDNRRIIGRSSGDNPQTPGKGGAIFFGTVGATGTANVTILGGSGTNNGGTDVSAGYGSATATLYGDFNQGLGFTATGHDYSLIDNTQTSSWDAIGAAMRSPNTATNTNPTSPTTYTGFLVGVADDATPLSLTAGYASYILMNNLASDFTMTVNPTTGVISGLIQNLEDIYNNGYILPDVTIGGSAATSAYVENNDMVAILSGPANLMDHGNFLVTEGPDAPTITSTANDFMTWGYWEMAFTDGTNNNHLFSSQSFFVAGQQTPTASLDSILNQTAPAITGTYNGKAFGVALDSAGQNTTQLTSGATHLVIDFHDTTAANAVTGTINFDQVSLDIASSAGALSNTGFSANVSAATTGGVINSTVNGAFFGTPAAGTAPPAVGGNFSAEMNTGVRYLGVFGGNR